jgi:hypothetical protein
MAPHVEGCCCHSAQHPEQQTFMVLLGGDGLLVLVLVVVLQYADSNLCRHCRMPPHLLLLHHLRGCWCVFTGRTDGLFRCTNIIFFF